MHCSTLKVSKIWRKAIKYTSQLNILGNKISLG